MTQPSDSGFVKRGFILLAGMTVLVAGVLLVLFYRPAGATPPVDSEEVKKLAPSPSGWEIRYSAAVTLARRKSPHVPWENFAEMLNEKQQLRNHRVTLADGKNVSNEASARNIMLRALTTLGEYLSQQDSATFVIDAPLSEVLATVDALTTHSAAPIRFKALEVQKLASGFRKS